jgi:hypothetical protein
MSGTYGGSSYGIYINQEGGTKSWSLYSTTSSGTAAPSYFEGNVGIGLTTPGAPAPLTVGTTGQFQVSAAGAVTAVSYKETLATPTNSSATCTAGQFGDDANYHYVCTATNTWKRAALSSF